MNLKEALNSAKLMTNHFRAFMKAEEVLEQAVNAEADLKNKLREAEEITQHIKNQQADSKSWRADIEKLNVEVTRFKQENEEVKEQIKKEILAARAEADVEIQKEKAKVKKEQTNTDAAMRILQETYTARNIELQRATKVEEEKLAKLKAEIERIKSSL